MNLFKNMHVLLRQIFVALVILGCASADVSDLFGSGANQQYTLEQAIRGTPNSDYPIYSEAPKTSFSCDGKDFGYYVDEEARCQVFRVCAHTDTSGMGFTFLCPNGTLFSQQHMVCDWYYNVKCDGSSQFFDMNRVLGKTDGPDAKIMNEIRKMMDFPFKNDRSGNGRATQQPIEPPFFGNDNRQDRDGFPAVPSFTGNGPSTGFVSGVPTSGGRLPPSTLGDGPIFVSNLGELSTDPNSSFDRQKSKVISVSPDSEDPSEASGTQALQNYPSNGGASRKGRKKNGNGNGYSRDGPRGVNVNNNGFPEQSSGDTVNIGGARPGAGGAGGPSTGPKQRVPQRSGGSNGGGQRPRGQSAPAQQPQGNRRQGSSNQQRPRPSNNQGGSRGGSQPSYSQGNSNNFPSSSSQGSNFNRNQPSGGNFNNFNDQPSGGNFNNFNDQPQSQGSFGGNNRGGNNGGSSNHDDLFNIVYSVINDRHGGLGDGNNGGNRRSDNFGSPPSYEIQPSVDLTQQFRQRGGLPFGDSLRGSFGQGSDVSPAHLLSQSSSGGGYPQSFRQQRPAQRRSGPNVEIVPVPLRHHSSSSKLEGESTNAQPYAIPQSVRDIKASNFVLNYNPILSKPTASRDEVLVQITKAEDTYVNDGAGRSRPLTGANKHNTKRLPANFARVQPASSQTRAVTPTLDVTGGRPSSYDVPLNSVGPLPKTRSLTGKEDTFEGYH